MQYTDIQINQRINKIIEDVYTTRNLCYNPTCPTGEVAINSHTLQKKVLVNYIAQPTSGGKKIIELYQSDYFRKLRYTNGQGDEFLPAGPLKNSLSFWGFCDKCDDNLFLGFEKATNPDYSESETQLLLSYRAYLRIMQIDEHVAVVSKAIMQEPFFATLDEDYKADIELLRKERVAASLKHYLLKKEIEKALKNPTNSKLFKFITFELPAVEIATSTFYSEIHAIIPGHRIVDSFVPDFRQNAEKLVSFSPVPTVFIHLIPSDKNLIVLIGYSDYVTQISNTPVEQIANLTPAEQFKLLSDVLITRVETWCISPTFYEKLKLTGQDKKILDAIHYHSPYENKHLPVDVNIFEGVV